jgi:hypothetical protein
VRSTAPVNDAALHHMQGWLSGGPPPPAQPRIEFAGDPPEIVRDEHGIARGGIWLPQVEVRIATLTTPLNARDFARAAFQMTRDQARVGCRLFRTHRRSFSPHATTAEMAT